MGRPKKPTALRVLEGDKHKDRYNHSEPMPDPLTRLGEPEMPLGPEGLKMWHRLGPRLLGLGLLTEVDTYAFTMLCHTWDGYTITPSNKMAALLNTLLGRFGCTPADRSKITGATNKESTDGMERLLAGGK